MATQARLISGGAWAGSAGAVTGDNIVDNIVAQPGGPYGPDIPEMKGDVNLVTDVATGGGVRLPTGVRGDEVWVRNAGEGALNVYPTLGGRINGAAVDAPLSLPVNKSALFKAIGRQDWITPT
jgi:hypothetical protein